MKSTFIAFLLLLNLNNVFAHALWIETNSTGKKGQSQEVKIFYGEYADNQRDSLAKWYSDMKDITVWLVAPDNQKLKLVCKPQTDHLLTTFIPEKDGVYMLTISHDVKNFPGTTRYQFNARAIVMVDKPLKENNILDNKSDINIYTGEGMGKVNNPIQVQTFYKNEAAAKITVSVSSPTGWVKNYETDENGILQFVPLWPGRYIIEIMRTEKAPGEHNGKIYQSTWRNATYCIEVKK